MAKTAKAGGTLKHRLESIEFFSDDLAVTGGGLEGIRTLGRSVKSRSLYLAELQARLFASSIF